MKTVLHSILLDIPFMLFKQLKSKLKYSEFSNVMSSKVWPVICYLPRAGASLNAAQDDEQFHPAPSIKGQPNNPQLRHNNVEFPYILRKKFYLHCYITRLDDDHLMVIIWSKDQEKVILI
jgi:hypothetical protein